MLNQFPRDGGALNSLPHSLALSLSRSLPHPPPRTWWHTLRVFLGAAHGELLKFLYRRWNVLRSVQRAGYYRLALNAIKLIPSKCRQITQKLLTLIFICVCRSHLHLQGGFVTFFSMAGEAKRRGRDWRIVQCNIYCTWNTKRNPWAIVKVVFIVLLCMLVHRLGEVCVEFYVKLSQFQRLLGPIMIGMFAGNKTSENTTDNPELDATITHKPHSSQIWH